MTVFTAFTTKNYLSILLLVTLLIAVLSTLVTFDSRSARANALSDADYYHTASALLLEEQDHYVVERKYVGKVSARQHADIGFELGGKIAAILVDEGQVVGTGEIIAQLDVELLTIDRQQIEAQLSESRAKLKLNESNIKRHKTLEVSGYSSAQRYDELEAEQSSLNASVARLDASIASIDSRINKATLRAPFSGNVTRRFMDEGAVTGAGNPVVRIQQEGEMEAHVGVPVRLLNSLRLGDSEQVVVESQTVDASLIAIGADVNPVTRTVVVRLLLPLQVADNQGRQRLLNAVNGSFIYLIVPEQVPAAGFWVPIDAITDGIRGLWNVFVLSAQDDNLYRIESRDVLVEYATDSHVFIRGAINHGEMIVKQGLHRLAPQQLVRINVAALAVNSVAADSVE